MDKIKTANKTICYFIKINGVNKLHSWDYPAYIPEGDKTKSEYYLFGVKISKEDWLQKKSELNDK